MNSLRPVATHTNFYRIAHKETVGHADAYVYTARPGRTFIVIYFRSLHFFGYPRTSHYFPMQKVEKIRFRISSAVVAPVNASRLRSAV